MGIRRTRRRIWIGATVAATAMGSPACVFAAEPVDLYSLSLDELMRIPVLSATSKHKESITESPGIVSHISRDDIAVMGASNLLDLIRRLPNVDVPSFYLYRNNTVSIRGQHELSDKRTLVLLNGRPMREKHNAGVNAPIYDGFPLSSIEYIEVVRGPGSVLHGTGAYSGIINIVTRPAGQQDSRVQLTHGSFDTTSVDASTSTQLSGLAINAGVKLLDAGGWNYQAQDSNNIPGHMDYGQDLWAGTLRADYDNLSIELFESHSKTDVLGTLPVWPADTIDLLRRFINIGYEQAINADWRLEWNTTYNRFHADSTGADNINGGEDYILELTSYGKLGQHFDLIAGGMFEQVDWYRETGLKSNGSMRGGRSYAEVVYRSGNGLRIGAGAQYNKDEGIKANTAPRLAITWRFTDYWGTKLLYGEAYRAANSTERFTNIPAIGGGSSFIGQGDLRPETIATLDGQLFYQRKNLFTALTWYKSTEKDTIVLDFSQYPGTFINDTGEIRYHGLEYEFKWELTEQFKLEGSWTYQANENDQGVRGTKLTPNHMVKLGLSHDNGNGITLGVFDSYFDQYSVRHSAVVMNAPSEDYHHLSINVAFDLDKMFRANTRSRIDLFMDNLLESGPVYAPDLARAEISTLPVRPGRAFYLRYQINL